MPVFPQLNPHLSVTTCHVPSASPAELPNHPIKSYSKSLPSGSAPGTCLDQSKNQNDSNMIKNSTGIRGREAGFSETKEKYNMFCCSGLLELKTLFNRHCIITCWRIELTVGSNWFLSTHDIDIEVHANSHNPCKLYYANKRGMYSIWTCICDTTLVFFNPQSPEAGCGFLAGSVDIQRNIQTHHAAPTQHIGCI